jgi:hypothetical protein
MPTETKPLMIAKPSMIAVALALALAACGNPTRTTSDPDRTAAGSTATAAAAGIAGGMAGIGVSTDDLPDFAELPPGARAIHNMKLNDGGRIGGAVSLEVRQSPAEVLNFYKQVFARHGLKIGIETLSTDVAMLNGQSADEGKMLNIMINSTDHGPTALNVVHARKVG